MRPCFNDHGECFLWLLPRLTENQRKKAAAKARVIKHREKLYANPQLLEEYRRKERERYMLVTEIGECVITLILFPLLYYAYIYIFFIKGVSDSGKGLLSKMFCQSVNISSCSTATVCALKKNPVLKHSPGSVNSMLLDMVGPLCLQSLGCVLTQDYFLEHTQFWKVFGFDNKWFCYQLFTRIDDFTFNK